MTGVGLQGVLGYRVRAEMMRRLEVGGTLDGALSQAPQR
ncbi:hypothetical protein OJJOAM_000226 [Cupriavidus sp. H18C1]